MTPLTQTKLLRVLQERAVRAGRRQRDRQGRRAHRRGHQPRPGGRLIAEGRFREDLYYRLNVLRDPPAAAAATRAATCRCWCEHFVRRLSRELGKDVAGVQPRRRRTCCGGYAWPGNVRELQSVLQAGHRAGDRAGAAPRVPARPAPRRRPGAAPRRRRRSDLEGVGAFVEGRLAAGRTDVHAEVIALVERRLFLQVLRHTGNNQSRAARILGITRGRRCGPGWSVLGISIERTTVDDGAAG